MEVCLRWPRPPEPCGLGAAGGRRTKPNWHNVRARTGTGANVCATGRERISRHEARERRSQWLAVWPRWPRPPKPRGSGMLGRRLAESNGRGAKQSAVARGLLRGVLRQYAGRLAWTSCGGGEAPPGLRGGARARRIPRSGGVCAACAPLARGWELPAWPRGRGVRYAWASPRAWCSGPTAGPIRPPSLHEFAPSVRTC